MPPSTPDHALLRARHLLSQGGMPEAERLCRDSLGAAPGRADAWALLGAVLVRSRRPEGATGAFRRAAVLQPTAAAHLNGLGVAQEASGDTGAAAANFRRAALLAPGEPALRFNLGNALRKGRRHGEAADAYAAAAAADPGNATFLSASIRERQQACRWEGIEKDAARLFALVAAGAAVHPFRLTALGAPLALQRRNAEIWSSRVLPRVPALSGRPAGPTPVPLTLGYLSGDFREHPVPSLMVDVLAAHDRARVRVNVYSLGRDDGSEWRRRAEAGADSFVDLAGVPAATAAQRIRQDGVHLLVDLMGWTRDARPGILAHRPAPVQAGWLGYPGTLGSPALDYIVADEVVLPPEDEPHFVERVVRLPGSYQPNSRRPAGPPPTRAAVGLPADAMVYCCFNLPWKLEPSRFRLWMRLLREVPGSVLWLLDGGGDATAGLRLEAAAAGVDPERLVIAPRLPPDAHLARCRLADLFLDTLPYNGHTTASDALWAGCPVLTRMGTGFAGRVAASLLRAAGLDEMIAADDDAYLAIARRLAERADGRAALRARLADPRALPIFDIAGFARKLEEACARMWAASTRM